MRFFLATCAVLLTLCSANAQQQQQPDTQQLQIGPQQEDSQQPQQEDAQQPSADPQDSNLQITRNGDWQVACRDLTREGQTTRFCEMQQTIERVEDGKPFLRIAIGYPAESQEPIMRVFAPLGVLLRPGMTMQIDDGKALQLPYQICVNSPPTCIVEGSMQNDVVALMKRGNGGKFGLVLPGNQNVEAPFSLKGFTKSIDSLK